MEYGEGPQSWDGSNFYLRRLDARRRYGKLERYASFCVTCSLGQGNAAPQDWARLGIRWVRQRMLPVWERRKQRWVIGLSPNWTDRLVGRRCAKRLPRLHARQVSLAVSGCSETTPRFSLSLSQFKKVKVRWGQRIILVIMVVGFWGPLSNNIVGTEGNILDSVSD